MEQEDKDMKFGWDENKRLKTLRERGIDFIDVVEIWNDGQRQERRDLRREYGEARTQTIGRLKFNLLFVVYTNRSLENGELVTRIISARIANARECEQYHQRTFTRGAA